MGKKRRILRRSKFAALRKHRKFRGLVESNLVQEEHAPAALQAPETEPVAEEAPVPVPPKLEKAPSVVKTKAKAKTTITKTRPKKSSTRRPAKRRSNLSD